MFSSSLIEDGRYGKRAVLTTTWSDRLITTFTRKSVVELELNWAKGWKGDDVAFLAKLPDLQAFEIFDFHIRDITPIHCLRNLRRLGVTTYCSTGIDFPSFPMLESCGLEWRAKAASLFECVTLKELFVNCYKGKSTAPFSNLVNLESLSILNAPVESLDGLRSLTRLRSLRLANLRKLTSLTGLENLPNLEHLEVHSCRAIRSIEEVGTLPQLKTLGLNNDGEIDSLKPLNNLSCLEWVLFYESTNIIDGDLSPLLRQKALSRVAFMNRRHYSHRREDIDDAWKR